jgi:hypothetical protein
LQIRRLRNCLRRAFTIPKREGQDDFCLPIGAAFAHQSGDGFNHFPAAADE